MVSEKDLSLIEKKIGRKPNKVEKALFEQLWSEHCAYRSSKKFLKEFPTKGNKVIVGPGDDAAIIELGEEKIALGIESHNHPSYVDPYNGAATGIGGIIRDILSMGARPVGLFDCIYFGEFKEEETRYLFEGVVEGISDYGNSIGVPTVGGQVFFDENYEGNPLVNVACVGKIEGDILTGGLKETGNKLILVGAPTGRDGLGGASFASEELEEEAEIEDRSAVQIGDPYTEKLLIDATLEIKEHVVAARDLGAAGLGGASCEMASDGDLGVKINLDQVHLRENLSPLEILLSESQERMLFEVRDEEIENVKRKAKKYDLESSIIGEVKKGERYEVDFNGDKVVDLPAEFTAEGAPTRNLSTSKVKRSSDSETQKVEITKENILDIISDPNNASKRWVYRQYDHEVGTRTVLRPGDDTAVLDIFNTILNKNKSSGMAVSCGCNPVRVYKNPYEGGKEAVFENIMNLASKGAYPVAIINCLNFGSPENPEIYWELKKATEGMGDIARKYSIPIVGGNVSLYNEIQVEKNEKRGAVKPTPTVLTIGKGPINPPSLNIDRHGEIVLAKIKKGEKEQIDELSNIIESFDILASHDVSKGGLIVSIAEMIDEKGASINIKDTEKLLNEKPGKCILVVKNAEKIKKKSQSIDISKIGKTRNSDLKIETPQKSIKLTKEEIEKKMNYISDRMQSASPT